MQKTLAENWKRFERNFRVYYEAAELHKKKGSTQVAILLHCAGEEASDRFDKFEFSDIGQDKKDNIEAVLLKFRNLCEPTVLYDTHLFFKRMQLPGESFESFLNALKSDAKKCEFGELENRFICMQIIFGHQDKLVHDKLLLDPNINLDKAIDVCLDAEASKLRRQINSPCAINAVLPLKSKLVPKFRKPPSNAESMITNCKYCGKQHKIQQCPAFGKICRNCGKRNHFANVCRSTSKGMHSIEAEVEDDEDNEQFFNIASLVSCNDLSSKINEYVTVKDHASSKYKILFNLDTGAEVNVIPKKFIDKMNLTLEPTKVTLSGIGNALVKPCSKVILNCLTDDDKCYSLLFYVSDKINHAILGAKACFELSFLKRVEALHNVELKSPLLLSDICNVYDDLFNGYGLYEKEYDLKVKSNVHGVVQAPHKVPYALQPKLKTYLQILKENGIIADVDEPTEWVHNIVVLEKKENNRVFALILNL